jgi:hypothetical protein
MRRKGLEARMMKSRKATAMPACTGQHVGAQRGGQVAAEEGDGGAEDGEDQHPQQHGALVVPPHAGDLVDQRLGRVRVGPHRLDGEVRRDVGVHEGEEGREHEAELDEGGRLGDGHQARIALPRAPRGQRHLHQRRGEREDEGEMSCLDDHGAAALPLVARGKPPRLSSRALCPG